MVRFRLAAFGTDPSITKIPRGFGPGTVPPLFARTSRFPYVDGFGAACARFARGGYTAINDEYRSPKKLTTAAFLFPTRKLAAAAFGPYPPELGLHYVDGDDIGAARLLFLLEDGKVPDRMRTVADFSGGWYDQWHGDDLKIVFFLFQAVKGNALCAGVREWQQSVPALRRNGEVTCVGRRVSLIIQRHGKT